jgi:hypothetical protein
MTLNQVLYLQAEIAHLYMKRHNISPVEFLEQDKKYGILEFLETGYEPFHLTGPEGVLDEVEYYIGSLSLPVSSGIRPYGDNP